MDFIKAGGWGLAAGAASFLAASFLAASFLNCVAFGVGVLFLFPTASFVEQVF